MMNHIELGSELLNYLAETSLQPGDRLPTIHELTDENQLGISTSKVREQLSIARALGLVEVKTKNGMQLLPFDFKPAVLLTLLYALARDESYFDHFAALRVQLELAFWPDACARLGASHFAAMRDCVAAANAMLRTEPIRIPNREHRQFHLIMFRDLGNPFVIGLLEAYWEAYELVQRNRYRDYDYLRRVWDYHEQILEELEQGAVEAARDLFIEHTRLLRTPPWRVSDLKHAMPFVAQRASLHAERT
ncbi:MAG: FCD domain-containing protein [Chloroflexi bacterium]|nr:FCD domain-containing protein [Chloroflexota bacterium]